MALQVDGVVQQLQYFSLAGAGQAADQHEVAFGHGALGGLEQEVTHGLVAANYLGVGDAGFFLEPLLGNLRAQAATKTVEVTVRVGPGERGPGGNAFVL
ncbi:hypothetical protein D3C80_1515990 [compost metagenome]